MTGWASFVFLCFLLILNPVLPMPKGSILKIEPNCSLSDKGNPFIKVTSDLTINAKAVCKNGGMMFTTSDNVNYYLNATFATSIDKTLCQFYRRKNSKVYTVKVYVSWGDDDGKILSHTEIKSVTCTFGEYGTQNTETKKLDSSHLAPREILVNNGKKLSSSAFKLKIVNVLNQTMTGSIRQGRIVSLLVEATGKTGVRVVQCSAIAPSPILNISTVFISAGCGNGRVLNKTEGFYTTGSQARSPYFNMFSIDNLSKVQFECKLSVCSSACDGNNCEKARKRRSADEELVKVYSDHIPLHL